MLEIGADFLYAINSTARTECGFATVDNVLDGRRADRMESFFLAETLKVIFCHIENYNHITPLSAVVLNFRKVTEIRKEDG